MRGAMVLLALMIALGGCTRPPHPTRVVDVSKGQYYTNDEIKGLSQAERDEYCRSIDKEIGRHHDDADRLQRGADSLGAVIDSLKAVNAGLVNQVRDLDNEIRQLRLARRAATSYLVKSGETLQSISAQVYGKTERWKEIYEANKDLISDPAKPLKPGIRLTIPAM